MFGKSALKWMRLNRESEKYFNRNDNRTHDLDVASVTLYHLSYRRSKYEYRMWLFTAKKQISVFIAPYDFFH